MSLSFAKLKDGSFLFNRNYILMKSIKEFALSLLPALGLGIVAAVIARFSVFPIMAVLHNRWIHIVSSESVDLVYFWVGQVVGSLVFVGYMYKRLRNRQWSVFGTIIAILIAISILIIGGLVLLMIL